VPLPGFYPPSVLVPEESLLAISANPSSSGGGFVTEKRVRCHFLCKKSECHNKALKLLSLPPAARNVPGLSGHDKHREGHRLCLSACSASEKPGVIWRGLKTVQIGTETAVGFLGGNEEKKKKELNQFSALEF